MTADHKKARLVEEGEDCGKLTDLVFRDPDNFKAGELHNNYTYWEEISHRAPSPKHEEVLGWIRDKVSIAPYFRHSKGDFKGISYDSGRPPAKTFKNNTSCKPFTQFVYKTLINRVKCGAVTIVGKVGVAYPPHIVLPLTVEPTKPRLCHDARYLNLWMCDMPFSLDSVSDLPRYVQRNTYQTVLDDKSGYDHILLTEESRTFFGIQWGGWYFMYNTLPFGWKLSPYVYHTTGLLASNFFRSIGIPCSLYIDDRHNGELHVPLDKGEYCIIDSGDARHLAAAESAVFLVAYHLVRLWYFLGLGKSVLVPSQTVPYLGFLSDSEREVFHLKPEKSQNFLMTPILRDLHWLPIPARLEFKILLLTFKCLHNQGLSYLRELLKFRNPSRTLHSSKQSLLQNSYPPNTLYYGERAFAFAAPKLWNSIREHIKSASSLSTFKTALKTYLFRRHLLDDQ